MIMFGTRRLIRLTTFWIALSIVTCSEQEGNFLWRWFSRGKSFLMGNYNSNSSRRTDLPPSNYDYDEPEHREVESTGSGGAYGDEYANTNAQTDDDVGWGWVKTGTKVVYKDNMSLYTLLGGLSFASFLATALLLLSQRNGTLLGRSEVDKINIFLPKQEEELQLKDDNEMGVKVNQLIYKMEKLFYQWWYVNQRHQEDRGSKGVQ